MAPTIFLGSAFFFFPCAKPRTHSWPFSAIFVQIFLFFFFSPKKLICWGLLHNCSFDLFFYSAADVLITHSCYQPRLHSSKCYYSIVGNGHTHTRLAATAAAAVGSPLEAGAAAVTQLPAAFLAVPDADQATAAGAADAFAADADARTTFAQCASS